MRKLTTPFARSVAILRSWLLAIAATTMLSVLPINFDRQFDGLSISLAHAAVAQCTPQPLIGSGCARASCMKAGPCYIGAFYQPRACLRWRCTGTSSSIRQVPR
jgi:hypothetical protein